MVGTGGGRGTNGATMSAAVLVSLCFLLGSVAACAWLWRAQVRLAGRQLRSRVLGRKNPQHASGYVPLDDQPAWLIADLARRLAQNPPSP